MVKAKVIRGVLIRGKAHAEGVVVEVTPQEFHELKSYNYVTDYKEPEPVAALLEPKKGKTADK